MNTPAKQVLSYGIENRSPVKRKIIGIFSFLGAVNLLVWLAALFTFHNYALLLGTCTLAYTFGLRHALDADHISAIDNVTRKLMREGKRPVSVGFYFSLGHSTIVILLSVLIAATAAKIQKDFPGLEKVGGLVGTLVSAAFLLIIAAINLVVLQDLWRGFRKIKEGAEYSEDYLNAILNGSGIMSRIFRPMFKLVDQSWKIYLVGFLFGLGFDTATEVGVLGISAAAATQHLPIWSILLFPALFTAGMCLVDTADGVLMLGAYGWAFINPMRKIFYNMTITSVSVLVALVVGAIEVLGVVGDQLDLHGPFWKAIGTLGDHFGIMGVVIIGVFLLSWMASTVIYRSMGYDKLQLAREEPPAESQ